MWDDIDFGDGPKSKVAKALGISDAQWKSYKNWIGAKESDDRYDIMGGANNHYAGRYQMGKAAIADAAQLLGRPVPSREAFLKNPKMQDEFFEAYTLANIGYLKGTPEFDARSPQEKLGIVGYAHNQGHGGAKEYMRTGQTGFDAFGTAGTDYLAAAGQAPGGPVMAGDPRGTTEADIVGQPKLGAVGAPPTAVQQAPAVPPVVAQAPDPMADIDFGMGTDMNEQFMVGTGQGAEVVGNIAPAGEAPAPTTASQEFAEMAHMANKEPLIAGTEFGKEMSANSVASFQKYFGDLKNAVVNYDDTAEGLKKLGQGLASYAGITADNPEGERVVDAVVDFYVERYGTPEKAMETIKKDPVGAFADGLTVLWAGGGTAIGASKAAQVAGVANTATKALGQGGRVATGVASAAEPLNLVTKPAAAVVSGVGKGIGYGTSLLGGVGTGAGQEAIQTAYKTAKNNARAGFTDQGFKAADEALRSQLRGGQDITVPADMARRGFEKIKQESKVLHDAGLDRLQAEVVAGQANKSIKPFKGKNMKDAATRIRKGYNTDGIDEFTKADNKRWAEVTEKVDEIMVRMAQTPGGGTVKQWDAAKRAVRSFYKDDGSKADAAIAKLADEIKGEIVKAAPKYEPLMRQSDNAVKALQELEKELSLGKKANVGQRLRKLQSALRAGAHQGWEYRVDLVKWLQDSGAPNLYEALSGQALKPAVARGLARYVTQAAGATGLGSGGIGALLAGASGGAALLTGLASMLIYGAAALPATSPRVWGEGARVAGNVVGTAKRAGAATKKARRATANITSRAGQEGIFGSPYAEDIEF